MKRLQVTMWQLLTAIFWLAVGFGCMAAVVRHGRITDEWQGVVLLAEILVGGAALGAGVGTLVGRQFVFAIAGAIGAFGLVAIARFFRW